MLAFLGIIALAYFTRTGLFKREHEGVVNAGVVTGVLVLSTVLIVRLFCWLPVFFLSPVTCHLSPVTCRLSAFPPGIGWRRSCTLPSGGQHGSSRRS